MNHLQELLDRKYRQYAKPSFIADDPISIPHAFSAKADIEIAALLAATLAWGSRPQIVKTAKTLMQRMDNAPADFVLNSQHNDRRQLLGFVYRTFQDADLLFFIDALHNIYKHNGGLETVFTTAYAKHGNIRGALIDYRNIFLSTQHLQRSEKHVANVLKKSAAKRLNMFLRWMVRSSAEGVDFGLWAGIPSSALLIPLDLHSSNVARKLGLLTRKQNDWLAVTELSSELQKFDPSDPVKYDFAIFGLGMFDKFWQ